MRIAFLTTLVTLAASIVAPALAQQAEDIVVAGKIVARVRDKGDQTNVFARAAKVQQCITECISKKEAGTPKMALKKEDGRWSIYNHTTMLIRVWPEDAKAQNIDELSLAKIWLKNFERELPNAEPFRFKFAREGDAAYERPIKPVPPVAEPDPGSTNVAEAPIGPNVLTQGPKRSTELLVVLDSFDIVRTYSKEEFEAKKDVLGERLLDRLRPFILGTVKTTEPVGIGAGAPITSPAPARVEPKLVPGGPVGPPPVPEAPPKLTPTPPETAAGVTPAAAPPSAAAPPKPPAAGPVDPYARVPQKERIRRKMNAVRDPLVGMKERGDPQAERVDKLLAAARQNLYSDQFDESEEAVDAALRILGLEVQ